MCQLSRRDKIKIPEDLIGLAQHKQQGNTRAYLAQHKQQGDTRAYLAQQKQQGDTSTYLGPYHTSTIQSIFFYENI